MGKLTINGHFQIAMLVYQRVPEASEMVRWTLNLKSLNQRQRQGHFCPFGTEIPRKCNVFASCREAKIPKMRGVNIVNACGDGQVTFKLTDVVEECGGILQSQII